MTAEFKQKIQVILLAGIALAAIRAGYTLYERHTETTQKSKKQVSHLDPDYYVSPKKLHPYDLKSARQLTRQPVWVKVGYSSTFYSYNQHHTDFAHAAGQLLPLAKLEIKDVVADTSPGSPDQRQVMAVFDQEGKSYAFPIGSVKEGNYQIYSDEMLFIQDPHELYKHWQSDVWEAIDKHEVKPGMNELQADFALGLGIPQRSDDASVRIVNYPNGDKPVSITYRNGKAVEIKPGPG